MRQETKEKIIRRLDHLREVLKDCAGDNPNGMELEALYITVRDIQPGLCEAIAEQYEGMRICPGDWVNRYREPIISDQEQKDLGEFLWADEEK